jgi:choline dehydrogenase-like flavoprotein
VVRTNAIVESISVDQSSGWAQGVRFVDRGTKAREEIRARFVVLAASTIETLRIMLNSRSPKHPNGVGNSKGNLGRYLMDHTMVFLNGPVSPDRFDNCPYADSHTNGAGDPYDFGNSHGFYIPAFANVSNRQANFIRGYGIQGAIGREKASWYLLSFGAMLPRYRNRIDLDPAVKDAWGIPAARIDVAFSENEYKMIEDQKISLHQLAREGGLEISRLPASGIAGRTLMRATGSQLYDTSGAFVPGTAIHEVGGAAMGSGPETSVVDAFNQCWDAPNVVVVDGACFVSTGPQGPALTIMALAARSCHHIAKELRNGAC